ncbi:hypothetical protein XENOCAPTIV_004529 [Xenoophorus captivus]|uniref:Uncharacterized protein n=1 Tax=Xenoophorus captivus TaxID=1517983 RepID=A0ABV0QYG9_9TELE
MMYGGIVDKTLCMDGRLCALVSIVSPIKSFPAAKLQMPTGGVVKGRACCVKKDTSFDEGSPLWIDIIGIPRGVPDENKLPMSVDPESAPLLEEEGILRMNGDRGRG